MIVSPFTPLFFNVPTADGIEGDYIQTFAPSDKILVQMIGSNLEAKPSLRLVSYPGGTTLQTVPLTSWAINSTTVIHFAILSPNPGLYRVRINNTEFTSEYFRVTDDSAELDNTTLIQYSMKDNRQRKDVCFWIDGMQHFFDWRVPGGFKDANWSFGVEGEQFVTPYADIAQLYGLESTQKRFTLGGSMGVPVWFGEMLNRILVCSHVYFDGVKYTRKETNTPELTQQLEGVNAFVFTQTLQQSVNLDPVIELQNQLIMRRIGTSSYRKITSNNYRKI